MSRLPRKTTGQPAWKHSKRSGFPASPKVPATPQENQRLETRHVDAEKRAFRARLPPILTFSTRYQTGWNVTKCHAWHAKRHDNLRGKHSKRTGFAASPIDTATPQDNARLATRHVDAEKPAFCARLPAISKGSVSYLSSPCFSTSLGGIGGPAHGIHGILAVMYWISIIRGGAPPPKMVMGSIPTGDAVTGPHIRGTLSMREMSL